MQKIQTQIKEHWLMILITLLPLLDIITYFIMDTKIGSVLTLTRFILLPTLFVLSFLKSKHKKKYYIFVGIVFAYIIGHVISCYISGYQNIVEDLSNMLRILYTPILLFSFIDLYKGNSEGNIVKGMGLALVLTIISIILAVITNTAVFTYGTDLKLGVIGWFYNKNTQSMILITLALIISIYSMHKKSFYYILPIVLFTLYINGTKTCYLSLIAICLMIIFYTIFELKDKKKLMYALVFLILAGGLYRISPTYNNLNAYQTEQKDRNDKINSTIKKPSSNDKDYKVLEETYRKFSLGPIIDRFGIESVSKEYNYSIDSFILSNTRMQKKVVARLIYDEEDLLSHLFGFEFTKINNFEDNDKIITYDLENDITALFYYCGYIGVILYFGFIAFYIIEILKIILLNPKYILKSKYMVWLTLVLLLILGAEYNGALLRRPNGNIYLALALSFAYYKFKKINTEPKKNKISFLLLHLGYGGIETATINTVNALINNYEIEVVSFYNVKESQVSLIDKRVNVKYLCKENENRQAFLDALHHKKLFTTLKEGIKATRILIEKKYLTIKWIVSSDSKIIVSTRSEFSKYLSKYKSKDTVAIAQEHHHHNNDKKYIRILSHKYKGIDYLMALTPSLKKDYEKFLKNNKHTKVIVMPNMIEESNTYSNLNNKNIITVSRLHPGKRVLELIDIASNIKDINNFYIIGDGADYELAKSKIHELNETKRIHLLGYKTQKEISEYLNKSSLFVMASISEGLPVVLLEAMSHGVPCIAYETKSGVKDIIEDGKNGYIIKNRNKEEFESKIEELLNDEKKLKKFSNNALITASNYSKETITKKWIELIEDNL